jgi:hypothetical protein
MKRSLGVTVIAALELLGSSLTLLMGVLMVVVMVFLPTRTQQNIPLPPTALKALLALTSLLYIFPALWGIASGVGLIRLKNWARISTIVFSVILILIGAFSGLVMLLMPMPAPNGGDPGMTASFRLVMGSFWLALMGIGIWWAVFFTRTEVRVQFVPSGGLPFGPSAPVVNALSGISLPSVAPQAPARPLSLTIIAWLLLIGCAFIPLSLAMRAPTFLLTKVVSGGTAAIYFSAVGLLHLYIGIGLLRLQPLARKIGVWYYIAMLLNAAFFYLAPGTRVRFIALMAAQQSMFPWLSSMQQRPELHFDLIPFMYLGACCGAIMIAIAIYFLVTRKVEFERAAAAALERR